MVSGVSIKDCRGVESITVVSNMEDGTMKTNQNGVVKIAENEATDSTNDNNVKRSRKLTEKGLQYKLEQLKTKREKINAKLLRKSGMVNDMLYSFTNASVVAEEMEPFNDMLKMLTAANEEYQHLLTENELLADSQWFEEAKRLEMEEKVAKAQARDKVLDLLDMPQLECEEDTKGRNIAHNNQMIDPNIALDKQYENWKEFKPGKKYHYSDLLFRNGEPNYTPSDHNSQSG